MDSQNKKRHRDESDDDNDTGPTNLYWPKYWIMQETDSANPISSLNPFAISKGIQSISSTLQVRRLRNDTLLIECNTRIQARSLERTTMLVTVPVKVTPHRTLNSCQGIIRCREIYDMTEEEIQLELAPQAVSKVKRFTFRRDNQTHKTNTYLSVSYTHLTLPTTERV